MQSRSPEPVALFLASATGRPLAGTGSRGSRAQPARRVDLSCGQVFMYGPEKLTSACSRGPAAPQLSDTRLPCRTMNTRSNLNRITLPTIGCPAALGHAPAVAPRPSRHLVPAPARTLAIPPVPCTAVPRPAARRVGGAACTAAPSAPPPRQQGARRTSGRPSGPRPVRRGHPRLSLEPPAAGLSCRSRRGPGQHPCPAGARPGPCASCRTSPHGPAAGLTCTAAAQRVLRHSPARVVRLHRRQRPAPPPPPPHHKPAEPSGCGLAAARNRHDLDAQAQACFSAARARLLVPPQVAAGVCSSCPYCSRRLLHVLLVSCRVLSLSESARSCPARPGRQPAGPSGDFSESAGS